MSFVWNRRQAEAIREEFESAMRRQIRNMQVTARAYLEEAADLERQALKQDVIDL